MDDIYNNIDDYNLKRKREVLIVFDDMIADTMAIKKFQAIVIELFIRCRKLNISLIFITQSYFSVPKEVILNCTHHIVMKIYNRRELQQKKRISTVNTTLPANDPMRFRKNFLVLLYKTKLRSLMTKLEQIKLDTMLIGKQPRYLRYQVVN